MVKVKGRKSDEGPRFTREGSVEPPKVGRKSDEFKGFVKEGSVDKSPKGFGQQGLMKDGQEGDIPEELGEWTEESDIDEDNIEERQTCVNSTDEYDRELKARENRMNSLEDKDNVNVLSKLVSLKETFSKTGNVLKKRYIFIFITLILPLLAIPCYTKLIANRQIDNTIRDENEMYKQRVTNFRNTIKKMEKDFPSQGHELWKNVFFKIKYVNESKPIRPAVFLFLHNDSGAVAECLAWKIGHAASTFLNTQGIIELPAENVRHYRDNEIVTEYREILKKKAVMIVYRLDQIPGIVAQSFHTICDTYNPLVNRAVLLFTLNSNELKEHEQLRPSKKAMELMKLIWKDSLIDASLDPLITRLTDTVVEVKPEEHISC